MKIPASRHCIKYEANAHFSGRIDRMQMLTCQYLCRITGVTNDVAFDVRSGTSFERVRLPKWCHRRRCKEPESRI